ncbi:septal ring lytic transglycosylase RlpA family protein [Falsiroseomonas sp. HW251]|uniref:septal ring lytic transglycosylase RlpA family protein n=1 Tax=Falsiroseomonas sp. HW251 TaxID=3390998 RepID=UPI003D317C09
MRHHQPIGSFASAAILAVALGACSQPSGDVSEQPAGPQQRGTASYYGPGFQGRPTASGERFDRNAPTAAHRSLPLGSVARVTNLETGQSETVTINDRGPYARGRIIDVSEGTAQRIGMKEDGTAPVEVTPLAVPGQQAAQSTPRGR